MCDIERKPEVNYATKAKANMYFKKEVARSLLFNAPESPRMITTVMKASGDPWENQGKFYLRRGSGIGNGIEETQWRE